jgi:hypothetical protein
VVDIAYVSGAEGPGPNPSRVPIRVLRGNIAMLLCIVDLIGFVCVLKKKIKNTYIAQDL